MDNVYDIKYEKNLNFILPLDRTIELDTSFVRKKRVLVFIHLYYLDTIKNYLKYIEDISYDIDILFSVSSKQAKEILYQNLNSKKIHFRIIEKKNRGRDISALLVAGRNEILKYEYVCFLHDKKAKDAMLKDDIEKWNRCLWENLIGSKEYIDNVFGIFLRNPQIGLLVPPFPLGNYIPIPHFYANAWGENFFNTKDLAEKMGLDCQLDVDKLPITLGTVFWARVSALKKLFEIEWKYEDFDEEPLKNDGTISHAIERILPYVAQDAGFETGWVMTDRYASEQFEYMQMILKKTFGKLNRIFDISCVAEVDSYEEKLQELQRFVGKYKRFYIYGAGEYGKKCYYTLLISKQRKPEAFLVSEKGQNIDEIQGIPVHEISEVELDERYGIIIGVSEKYQKEILGVIKKKAPLFDNIYLYQRV